MVTRPQALPGRALAAPTARPRIRGDYAYASIVVVASSLFFLTWRPATRHWFLLPLSACGLLAGLDVIRWLRGRLDTFDPRTLVSCAAFYGFFLAPILHVVWDRFGVYGDLRLAGDWRPWLGSMAILNLLGLAAYRVAHDFAYARARPAELRWEIEPKKFLLVIAYALGVSLLVQFYFFAQLRGVEGVIEAYETDPQAFEGKGWMLLFAWPFAILSFIAATSLATEAGYRQRRGLFRGMVLLGILGSAHFLLMGWRGSRSAVVWALFWMAGMVHYRFHKFSPRLMGAGLVLLMGFMYFYGFYKERGREGLEVLLTPAAWLNPQGYLRDYKTLLLLDLARADINAFILHNLVRYPHDYDYRWGLTYAGAMTVMVPRNIWPDRPKFKVEAGTEAQFGKGYRWQSARVYGLSGEALLNFGPLGVPLMFGLFGWAMGWYRRKFLSWEAKDLRLFLAPFATILFLAGLTADSDNIVFAALSQGSLVFLALFLASRRVLANLPRT